MSFSLLEIVEKRIETPDAFTLVFRKPEQGFSYLPGQYLTLRVEINGKKEARAYSLSSSPLVDQDLAVTIKRLKGGVVSGYLWENAQKGQKVEVYPPLGNFIAPIDPRHAKHYILVGAGSGITPLMSIIKSVLAGEPHSRITLLYGNRNVEDIIFYDTLNTLAAQKPEALEIIHSLTQPPQGWEGHRGRLLGDHLYSLLRQATAKFPALDTHIYLCGPADILTEGIEKGLSLGIPREKIHTEYYTAPLKHLDEAPPAQESLAIIHLDRKTHHVLVKAGQTILEAAIEAGLDPPYACQEGICCTCRALLHSGQVYMREREGLSDWEIEKGYILTCQSLPQTPEVELTYG
ncbi:MAG: 2Fe-2S iron-sulfur cluster-binding protein [Bacteroidia bacterium]